MQTYELAVTNRSISAMSDDTTLVRTSVGVDKLHILFGSAEWLDFDLSVAFSNGSVIEEVPLTPSELGGEWLAEAECDVPSNVLLAAGQLGVTVHGTDEDGNHIITERAFPLTVEAEGDGIGAEPQPNPS